MPVCAGAATVALEPRVNSQRAQEAGTSSKVSLGYGGSCFFFLIFYTLISGKFTEACMSLIINFNVDSD